MSMTIRPATRQGVRPLICFYSESGGGKTYGSLLVARGFVGPKGKMVLVDTESGRGELYADVKEFGGYDVLPLEDPFSPSRYMDAIEAVEQSGAAIGILDSGSHEWEGIGGVLDMAEKAGGNGLAKWQKPKMEHALFLQRLLRSSIPWIICLRAKFKTRQIKEEGKKTEIVKDDFPTPIQADDFIFEATVHGLIDLAHNFQPRKISHPDLADCLPKNQPLTMEHGRLIAEWCAMGGKKGADKKARLLAELRTLTEPIHKWKRGVSTPAEWEAAKAVLEVWLEGKEIIGRGAQIGDLEEQRLAEVLAETKKALAQ
jgi:hypothetical protein